MTTAASAACGISATTGARKSSVASTAAAVDQPGDLRARSGGAVDRGLRRPAADGMLWKALPTTLASPMATSSRFGVGNGSPARTNARPAAIVSTKLISAMPTAAGQSVAARRTSRQGERRESRLDPADESRRRAARERRTPLPRSPPPPPPGAPAHLGRNRSRPTMSPSNAAPRASVTPEVSGTCCTRPTRLCRNVPLATWMPSSFGIWSTTITTRDAGLEAGEHRRRDEIREEPQPQDRGERASRTPTIRASAEASTDQLRRCRRRAPRRHRACHQIRASRSSSR